MNTLGKAITKQFFHNESGFDLLQHDWQRNWQDKSLVEKLEPIHFFLYQALRGKDWRKAFTAVTNDNKIENGYHPLHKARDVLRQLRFIVDARNIEAYNFLLEPLGQEVTWASARLLLTYPPSEANLLAGPSYINIKVQDKAA